MNDLKDKHSKNKVKKISKPAVNRNVDSQSPQLWDEVAEIYAEEADSSELKLGHEIECLLADIGIKPGASLLEVGCGCGHLSGYLASKDFKTTLMDFSKVAIAKAKAYYEKHNLTGNFILCDMMELSTKKVEPHDVVWNSGVFEHFDSWQVIDVLKRMGEVARKFIIVLVPNARSIPYLLFRRHAMENNEWLWGRELLRKTMRHLAEAAGLEVIEERYLGHHYSQDHLNYVKSELGQEYGDMYQQNLIPDDQGYLIAVVAQSRTDKEIVGYEELVEKILKEEATVAKKTYSFDLSAISNRLQKVQEARAGLESQLKDKNDEVANLQGTMAGLESQIESKDIEFGQLKETVSGLESQLTDKADEVANLQGTMAGLESQIESKDIEFGQLKETVSGLESQLTDKADEVTNLQGTMAGLESQIESKDIEFGQLKETVSGLESQLTDKADEVTNLQGTMAGLESQIEIKNLEIERLQETVRQRESSLAWRFSQFYGRYFSTDSRFTRFISYFLNKIVHSLEHRNTIKTEEKKSHELNIFKKILKLVLPRVVKNFYWEFRKEYALTDNSKVILYSTDASILPWYLPRRLINPYTNNDVSVKVSLIATVKNEAANAKEWLSSLLLQTRRPDEIVIVDGGSTDGTVDIINGFAKSSPISIRVIEATGVNIAQGRNIAIKNTAYSVIVSSDFGCILDKDWLSFLVMPFEMDSNIEVSAGFYQGIEKNHIDRVGNSFFVPDLNSIDPQSFFPSSRSVAFKKTCWARVGGYPEWLSDTAEDTLFDFELKGCGGHWAFVPEAKVYWSTPRSLTKIFRTVYRYARGDGEVGLFAANYWHKAKAVLKAGFFLSISVLFMVLSLLLDIPLILIPALVAAGMALVGFWHNINIARSDAKIQLLGRYAIILAILTITQVIGFTLGVANRPKVRKRQSEQHVDRLKQIVAQHPNAKGIVVYPPTHDWGFMFQRPHQMARAFAKKGYLYFFCTNNEKTDTVIGFQKVEPALYVCRVPLETFSALKNPIVYIGSPWHRNTLSIFDHPQTIYDHYDDLEVSSANPDDHMELLQAASVVLATNQRLLDAVREYRPDALLIPNGVDYERIQQNHPLQDENMPLDLKSIAAKRRPIVGYCGALAEWFDYDLLLYIAKRRSDLEFVLIGVDYDGSLNRSKILDLRNIHWLSMKTYDELFKYVWRFDIGIIPFKINNITLSTSPIKLFEYMACAKPVVATALLECKRYEGVFVAETYEQFVDCLDRALSVKRDQDYLSVIDKIARENTWDSRVDKVIATLKCNDSNQTQPQKKR